MFLHDSYGCHPEAISRLKYGISEVWQSGRLRLTVNQVLTARWFESISLHQDMRWIGIAGGLKNRWQTGLIPVRRTRNYPTHIEWCGKESSDSVVGSLAKSRDG